MDQNFLIKVTPP